YWMREKKAELIEIPNLGEIFNVHIVFSKKIITNAQFEKINKRLQALKSDKTFEQIAKKYGLTLAK
ncbi:MAG: amino acid ABC transporter substrate-binding protein, partial [Bdellovibrio sp.]|nr:amino acid ABC transporter substrate-binding protein [Bdellovibrio sp.]